MKLPKEALPLDPEEWNAKDFMRWAGVRLMYAADGRSRVELPLTDGHRGGAGTPAINGAILSYLHDIAQGLAVRSCLGNHVASLATIHLSIDFLGLLHAHDVVRAEGRAVRVGRSIAFAESEVRDDQAELCSRSTGSFRIRRKPECTHDR
jgi:uncharacterized protein (TIGR00369 family)